LVGTSVRETRREQQGQHEKGSLEGAHFRSHYTASRFISVIPVY
jgi:hypothetical protein